MATFERSIIIRTPLKLVYDFFFYTPNTRMLMPFPFTMVDITMPHVPEVGERLTMDMRAWALRQRWVLAWKELREPSASPLPPHPVLPEAGTAIAAVMGGKQDDGMLRARIILQAEYSPFLFYVHTLTLREAAENGPTELHERVDYEQRSGIGSWLVSKMVLGEFDRLYTFRQGRARRILERAHRPLNFTKQDEENQAKLNAVQIASVNEVRFGEGGSDGSGDESRPSVDSTRQQ
ncbi:MAG: hypothetical protein ACAI35_23935 [Candidatus Methylacidiphilales bacterium]